MDGKHKRGLWPAYPRMLGSGSDVREGVIMYKVFETFVERFAKIADRFDWQLEDGKFLRGRPFYLSEGSECRSNLVCCPITALCLAEKGMAYTIGCINMASFTIGMDHVSVSIIAMIAD